MIKPSPASCIEKCLHRAVRTFVRPLPKNKYLISIWCAFDVLIWLHIAELWVLFFRNSDTYFPAAPHFSKPYTHILILKFIFFKKAQKVWQNFPVDLMFTYYTLKQRGDFANFLWHPQKTWTVCPSTLKLHQKLGIQILFIYIDISYLLLVLLILLTLLFKCYSSFRSLEILLGWI